MLADSVPVSFVPTTNLKRAKDFYGSVLGLQHHSDAGPTVFFSAGGGLLALSQRDHVHPPEGTVAGWVVPRIGSLVRDLEKKGVHFERYPDYEQDEHGIWTAPNGTRVAWFRDPDGNILSLTAWPV